MDVIQPTSWTDALLAKEAHPDAIVIQGGTDVMVELNFDRCRPKWLLDLSRVPELKEWWESDNEIWIGSGVTYTRVINEIGKQLPALAMAARTVGSPQIRNRGTVGGNLGAASPAGDSHPPLLACRAKIEVASASATRTIAIDDYYAAPKRSTLAADELIASIRLPIACGAQQFSKIGTRNAMVIAVCSLSVALHPSRHQVGVGIGSAGPTPLRATEAEQFLEAVLSEHDAWGGGEIDRATLVRFGQLVSKAASPISDVRGTKAYRRHALSVLGERLARWTVCNE